MKENKQKYRIQLAFDIKDESNKSVLHKTCFNTVSRSIAQKPSDEQLESCFETLRLFLSQSQDMPQFGNLFYIQIPDISIS